MSVSATMSRPAADRDSASDTPSTATPRRDRSSGVAWLPLALGASPTVVRCCGGMPCDCDHDEDERTATVVRGHSAPGGRASDGVPLSVARTLQSPGRPLDPALREEMSGLLGRDLPPVRVHTDAAAGRSAADIGALAYAAGPHVVFGADQYRPGTAAGRRLLAHELAHVAQQPAAASTALVLGSPDAPAEAEAATVADRVTRGAPAAATANPAAGAGVVRRQPAPASGGAAPHVTISCEGMTISFVSELGAESYPLTSCDIPPNEYTATVNVTGQDLELDFGESAAEGTRFTFSYTVAPGQRDPTQLFSVNGQEVSVSVDGAPTADGDDADLTSHVDEELARELAAIDAGMEPGAVPSVPTIPPGAVALSSVVSPDAEYAFAVTPGFIASSGYSVPQGLLAEQALAAQAETIVAAQGVTTVTTTVVEGETLAQGLIATGETILAVEAGGAGEGEFVAGPPGWVVGAIVLAVAGAAIGVGYLLLRPSATTTTTVPVPVPTTTTTTTARRWPNQTCENSVLDDLEIWMHGICDRIPGASCSPSRSPKMLARIPCSQIRLRIQAIRACLAARQHVQNECFGGVPDARHEIPMNELTNALNNCLALELVNCAPGHPMADL